MPIITQISCVQFFLRLNKMSPNRLNHIIFKESCHLADKRYKNWAFSIQELLLKEHQNIQFNPTVDGRYSLVNYRDVLISLYTEDWIQEINEIRTESGSGGRLNLYHHSDPHGFNRMTSSQSLAKFQLTPTSLLTLKLHFFAYLQQQGGTHRLSLVNPPFVMLVWGHHSRENREHNSLINSVTVDKPLVGCLNYDTRKNVYS